MFVPKYLRVRQFSLWKHPLNSGGPSQKPFNCNSYKIGKRRKKKKKAAQTPWALLGSRNSFWTLDRAFTQIPETPKAVTQSRMTALRTSDHNKLQQILTEILRRQRQETQRCKYRRRGRMEAAVWGFPGSPAPEVDANSGLRAAAPHGPRGLGSTGVNVSPDPICYTNVVKLNISERLVPPLFPVPNALGFSLCGSDKSEDAGRFVCPAWSERKAGMCTRSPERQL